ncbi:YjjG family noncanonical pyrimidine nucleotidase [Paenibacillaceae bacterium WGS1546]|uniref:YjjG family noncanonical pyrimidine nucleotidase n=1 Tax=Cohnella sp. WGS1546 TaxID=3366810 RepID=UPI00372D3E34
MYQAVLFDLDNTLLNYSYSEIDCMRRTLRDHRLLYEEQDGWNAFWEAFSRHNAKHWFDFVEKRGPHRSIRDVLFRSFQDTLQLSSDDCERLSATYWDYFCHTCHFESGAEEILLRLRPRFKLGIISNGIGEAQGKRLAAGNVREIFQTVVVSDEAGVRKPRKEIFDIALQEMRLDRREVVFVGDSLTDDYAGARNAGIDFCFYNNRNAAMPGGVAPDYVIRELQELTSVIGLNS